MTNDERDQEEAVAASYQKLTKLFLQKGWTVTTMESATSGQIISLFTDTEGASGCVKGAFVTYCNEAKIACGVPGNVIETYSVYSKQTALAMAQACRNAYDANIGIGVTGTMGNVDPANAETSVPGEVYFAFAIRTGDCTQEVAFRKEIAPQNSRRAYKTAVAREIANELWSLLGEQT